MSEPVVHDVGGPLSWRDVYAAVGNAETRIIAAVNSAVIPLTATTLDHESRIRAVEAGGSPHAQTIQREVDLIALRLAVVEKTLEAFVAREKGVFATFSVTQKFVLTVAAVIGIIVALLDATQRLSV